MLRLPELTLPPRTLPVEEDAGRLACAVGGEPATEARPRACAFVLVLDVAETDGRDADVLASVFCLLEVVGGVAFSDPATLFWRERLVMVSRTKLLGPRLARMGCALNSRLLRSSSS
jgi:hypothetical protein